MGQIKRVLYDLVEFVVDSLTQGSDIEEIDELVENSFPEYYDFYLANKDFIMEEVDTRIEDDEYIADVEPREDEVEDHEDWIDPAGGVHRWDDDDPASMYESESESAKKLNERLVNDSDSRERSIDLRGPDGNAFVIIGIARNLTRQLKDIDPDKYDWERILPEMTSGDYKNLVHTFEKYFGDYITIYGADVLDECCGGGIVKRPRPIRRPTTTNLPPKPRLHESEYIMRSLFEK